MRMLLVPSSASTSTQIFFFSTHPPTFQSRRHSSLSRGSHPSHRCIRLDAAQTLPPSVVGEVAHALMSDLCVVDTPMDVFVPQRQSSVLPRCGLRRPGPDV